MALICNHGLKLGRFCIAGAVLFMAAACGSAHALTNYGCNDEKNDRITPELALCTVHAYNIGQSHNPDDAAQKQLMQDVVALKTTVITQQMYKQYEYMDAMIKRFKTQLEKAVLTSKLQMAGASTGTTGAASVGGSVSKDKNIVLAGTQNCMLMGTPEAAIDCMQSNVRIVINAINSGNSSDARKQLLKDLDVANTWGVITKENDKWQTITACNTMSASKRDTILQCAQQLNVQLARYAAEQQRQKQQTQKQ